MCHPAILAAVSVAGSLAGGAVQAQGARQQADAQAKAEERRAELADRQKAVNQTQASFERKRTLDKYERALGFNRAAGAERGLSQTGSLNDVANDNAFEAAQSIEAIRYGAEGKRDNLTFEAKRPGSGTFEPPRGAYQRHRCHAWWCYPGFHDAWQCRLQRCFQILETKRF